MDERIEEEMIEEIDALVDEIEEIIRGEIQVARMAMA